MVKGWFVHITRTLLINAYFIYRDNIPCICLGQWDLSADYFEDEMLSGMIPVLFAENPSEAEKGLLKDLISARKDLDRINRAFFIPEAVDLENALKVVKKPRVGEAEYAFKERNLDRLFEPRRFPPGLILLHKYFNILFILEILIPGISLNKKQRICKSLNSKIYLYQNQPYLLLKIYQYLEGQLAANNE